MIKDIELIIGRKIRGLKDKEIDSILKNSEARIIFTSEGMQIKKVLSLGVPKSQMIAVDSENFKQVIELSALT